MILVICSSTNIFWVIKWRKIRLAGHVTRLGERITYTGFWWGNLMERDLLEVPGVDGRIIFNWIFRKRDMWAWTGSS